MCYVLSDAGDKTNKTIYIKTIIYNVFKVEVLFTPKPLQDRYKIYLNA